MKKLVGEGKPFHSAVDKAAKGLKRKVGTGAEFMKELMGITGIKPTEINERGLNEIMGMPKMTHDQFMSELGKKPAPAIGEKVLGGDPDHPDWIGPYHYQWSLPGGENYREMLIKAPKGVDNQEKIMELEAKLRRIPMFNSTPEQQADIAKYYNQVRELKEQQEASPKPFQGVSGHFGGEPGILASMRLKDRLVEQPAEMRHVAFNKKSGFPSPDFATPEELDAYIKTLPANIQSSLVKKQAQIAKPPLKLLHLEELQSDWHQQGRDKGYQKPATKNLSGKVVENKSHFGFDPDYQVQWEDGTFSGGYGSPEEAQKRLEQGKTDAVTSGVPDAPFKKNWEEMALKRLVHHAAEKGYHGVVVTPGAEQADRYSLAKHIDSIMLVPNPYPNKNLPYYFKAFDKQGNRVADDAVNEEKLQEYIGKEPAQQLLSSQANPMGERMISGANIVTGGEGMKAFYDKKVPNILNSIGKKYGVKTQLHGYTVDKPPLGNPYNLQIGTKPSPMPTTTLHHFPITEDMRKDILTNGLPLYKQGGKVHMAKGDDMDHMRLALMNKKNGGSSKTTKGYVVHEPLKPHPEVGKRFTATPQGNLAPMQAFDLMKQEGKGSIVPIPYDATTRDMLVTNVSGHNLTEPLLTEAGFDYSLDPTHMAQNIGGASNRAIAKRVQSRVDQAQKEHGGDVFLAPNTMGEDAENFSHHPAHIVLDLMSQRQLKKNTLRALSDDLRGQFEVKRNAKTGATTKIYPYKNFLGYDHPNVGEQIMKGGHGLETTAGNLRKKMIERLGLINMQKLLDYNMGDLKAAILDPEIATDPKAYMGRTFVKAQPGAALRPSTHTSYDTDYTGTNVGGLGANRPFEILMPDVTEDIYKELNARPAKVKKTPAQMRAQVIGALEKRKERFAQPINARVINNAGLYEEGLRQGEFDPKNIESVLAYFGRKGGYAEGGMVDIKNIGVEEAPNMDVKAFIPPRPGTATKLPVGGIFQQTPQQPMQGMPQQQDQQPQGAPFQSQGAPAQPPSNILQMTPQGQAMSAMRPPQMARGGKVDRDMMMLHVMNRKMKVKHG